MHEPLPLDRPARYTLVILAVLQGWLLYALHLALEHQSWPATDPRWLKALYTVVIALPGFFYLALARHYDRRNLYAALLLGPLLFWLGWHLGWVGGVREDFERSAEFAFPFVLSLGVALFILAFYFRSWSESGNTRFPYTRLIALSWENALTLALLGAFVCAFWLLLGLWALLFTAVEIDFFRELFAEPLFVYPVTWLVGGLGLVLIRTRIRLIATVQYMCEVLIKALLPLAAFIVVLFLATLPFIGLQPVWETGHASVLMMLLATVLLFFFNAVLSDHPDHPPYPAALRWFVYAAVALLPVNALLAGWSLQLRIEQYGLSFDRLWAAVILLLLTAYTAAYALWLARRRDAAIPAIQGANRILAVAVAAVLLLVNTPLADLRGLAARSQIARLTSGAVEPAAFDYAYLRFELGAYGVAALRGLLGGDFAAQHPGAAQRIAAILKQQHRWSHTPAMDTGDPAAVRAFLHLVPGNARPPDDLLTALSRDDMQAAHCLSRPQACLLTPLRGAHADGLWALFTQQPYTGHGRFYARKDGAWRHAGQISRLGCLPGANERLGDEESLEETDSRFFVLSDGECFYLLSPDFGYFRQA